MQLCHANDYQTYNSEMKDPALKAKSASRQSALPFERVVTPSKIALSEKLITNYIIESIIPLSTVDNPAFKAWCTVFVMAQKFLTESV